LTVSVHAIGDLANSIMLNIFGEVINENPPNSYRNFRIEHAQHLRDDEIPKFRRYNITASMQPSHLMDDGQWAAKIIGPDHIQYAYPIKSLLSTGANLIFGSDWGVAPPIPLQGIFAAVTRQTYDGKNPNGWNPDQKINVKDALLAFTKNPLVAFKNNLQLKLGQISQDYMADFTVLYNPKGFITDIKSEYLNQTIVMYTVVNGTVVYEKI